MSHAAVGHAQLSCDRVVCSDACGDYTSELSEGRLPSTVSRFTKTRVSELSTT